MSINFLIQKNFDNMTFFDFQNLEWDRHWFALYSNGELQEYAIVDGQVKTYILFIISFLDINYINIVVSNIKSLLTHIPGSLQTLSL